MAKDQMKGRARRFESVSLKLKWFYRKLIGCADFYAAIFEGEEI
jgi:hypothetical protein